jgi:hypothetical protein
MKFTSFITAICFLICFLAPNIAYSSPYSVSQTFLQTPQEEPKISPLQKGDKAPFSGTLFNSAAAAKIMVDLESAEEKCSIEVEKEVGLATARLTLDMENLRASKIAAERRYVEVGALKDEQIKFLEEQAIKSSKKSRQAVWWLLGGVLTGIGLSVGAAFIAKEVQGTNTIVIQ